MVSTLWFISALNPARVNASTVVKSLKNPMFKHIEKIAA